MGTKLASAGRNRGRASRLFRFGLLVGCLLGVLDLRGDDCQTVLTRTDDPAETDFPFKLSSNYGESPDKVTEVVTQASKKGEAQAKQVFRKGLQSAIVGVRKGAAVVLIGTPFARKVVKQKGKLAPKEWVNEPMTQSVTGKTTIEFAPDNPEMTSWQGVIGAVAVTHSYAKMEKDLVKDDHALDVMKWLFEKAAENVKGGDQVAPWITGLLTKASIGQVETTTEVEISLGGSNTLTADSNTTSAIAKNEDGELLIYVPTNDTFDDYGVQSGAFSPDRKGSTSVTIESTAEIAMEASEVAEGRGVSEMFYATAGIRLCPEFDDEQQKMLVAGFSTTYAYSFGVVDPPDEKKVKEQADLARVRIDDIAKSSLNMEFGPRKDDILLEMPNEMRKYAKVFTEVLPTIEEALQQ